MYRSAGPAHTIETSSGPLGAEVLLSAGPALTHRPLPGLTIVLPCFNECANVAAAIANATLAAERCAEVHEIVVVDDGSTDATVQVAADCARRDARVRLVIHPRNAGYGEAVRSGIAAAQQPWVLLTDADLQFDLTELATFLPATEVADAVVGWRRERQDPAIRRANAAAWNWLVRRAFGLDFRDVDCAFKLVRRDVLQALTLQSGGAMISTELLVRCVQADARIVELGVHHHPRTSGAPTGASPRVIVRAFRELFALRRALGEAAPARAWRE